MVLIHLTLSAKNYSSAELHSKNVIKYGRFDVRMRAVSGSGIISSFFLYYDDSYLESPEPWQEIDIEIVGKTDDAFQSNSITGTASSKTTSEKWHDFENLSQNYHTYSYEWPPDYIAWFFDGVEVRRTTGAQVTDCQQKDMS
jgi:endo-1,3-1,4-beta-glycanase ExoK